MKLKRIEPFVTIPGPRGPEQPLQRIEEEALRRFDPVVLLAVQAGELQRIIDHTGNYFLVFPSLKNGRKKI